MVASATLFAIGGMFLILAGRALRRDRVGTVYLPMDFSGTEASAS